MAVDGKDRKNFVKVDKSKVEELYKLASKKGITITALNESIGHTSGFLKQCCYNGYIKKADVMLIKMTYDIDVEYKEPIKEEVPEKESSGEVAEMLDTIKRRICATNIILKDSNQAVEQKLDNIQKQNGEIINTLHTIGNLLAQINEKVYKEKK
jgi:hypothetical protein